MLPAEGISGSFVHFIVVCTNAKEKKFRLPENFVTFSFFLSFISHLFLFNLSYIRCTDYQY